MKLWLNIVPDHTVSFLRILLLYQLASSLAGPFNISVLATGEVKRFQLVDGAVRVLILPTSYICFKWLHTQPEMAFWILLFSEIASVLGKIYVVLPMIGYRKWDYAKGIVMPLSLVLVTSVAPSLLVCRQFGDTLLNFVLTCVICWSVTSMAIWIVGLNSEEKSLVRKFIISKICSK